MKTNWSIKSHDDGINSRPFAEGLTPNPFYDAPIQYRGWEICRWTGWKGNKALLYTAPGTLTICVMCGKPIMSGDSVYMDQGHYYDERPPRHWDCGHDQGLIYGQWVALKRTGTGKRWAYASAPGSQGEFQRGDCFDIGIQPGQRPLTYTTPPEELDQAREEALTRLKAWIDQEEERQ